MPARVGKARQTMFSALTFNMQNGQVWDEENPDEAEVSLARAIAFLREQDADIIFLQEVERGYEGGQADRAAAPLRAPEKRPCRVRFGFRLSATEQNGNSLRSWAGDILENVSEEFFSQRPSTGRNRF